MADMDEVVGTVVAEVVVAAVSQRPTLPRLVALGGRRGGGCLGIRVLQHTIPHRTNRFEALGQVG